jgi:hypothetical protein
MSELLRIAFINTSKATHVTIQVVTQDAVECRELLTTTPATEPDQNPGMRWPAGPWTVDVPPGKIIGFVTQYPVKITNPNSAAVSIIYTNGKDPWPQPPPVLSFASVPDLDIRYNSFLLTGALPEPTATPIVMTLAPPPEPLQSPSVSVGCQGSTLPRTPTAAGGADRGSHEEFRR